MSEMIVIVLLAASALALMASIYLLVTHTKAEQPMERERVEYAAPDFSQAAGFRLTAVPGTAAAEDSILHLRRLWLLDGHLAELEFQVEPQWTAFLRVGKGGSDLQLQDYAQQYESRTALGIGGTPVVLQQNPGREALATWSKNGLDHALYYPETEPTLAGGTLYQFVQNTDGELTR